MNRALCLLLLCSASLAAKDPFVGKWRWNLERSRYPALVFQVTDEGSNRFKITFTDGTDVSVLADGSEQRASTGSLLSFRKVDGQTWQLTRRRAGSSTTLYKIGDRAHSMTATTISTLPNRDQETSVSRWNRIGAGQGIVGDWKLLSATNKASESAVELDIALFAKDGLSFITPAQKSRLDLKFDGNDYEDRGPNEPPGSTYSARRPDARTIMMTGKRNGEPADTSEYRVSADGKTIAVTHRLLNSKNSRQPMTGVYDRIPDRR